MTPREHRQRQVDAMWDERERRDHEREHGLSPWMHVDANPPPRKADPTTKPFFDQEAFNRFLQNRYNERHGL